VRQPESAASVIGGEKSEGIIEGKMQERGYEMALSSTKIIKVIVVTDNLENTVAAYKTLFGTGKAPGGPGEKHEITREPYIKYKGENLANIAIRVESVFSDNFWFEIIQPLGENDPWSDWLKAHGTSICSVCLLSDGPIEHDEAVLKNAGFASLFKQEKGYEVYEYFDTAKALGVLTEVKEQYK
jgi:hypothetical protein